MITDTSTEKPCGYSHFKRVRYFHGMLLTDRDFREEQIYHLEKRRLLNRMLHGWGVVCGLGIDWTPGKKSLIIKPGLALDCHGNEIFVCEPYQIDVSALLCTSKTPSRTADPCEEPPAPTPPNEYYLAVCYQEMATDKVAVYAPSGSCEEKTCETSRYAEGFCFELYQQCPKQPAPPPGLIKRFLDCDGVTEFTPRKRFEACANLTDPVKLCKCEALEEFCSEPSPCPGCCPEKHCIVLGKIRINSTDKTVEQVWINECRTYVLSANLIKYLLTSTLSGLQEKFKLVDAEGNDILNPDRTPKHPPDPNLIHTNPIAALCWSLRHLVINGESIEEIEEGTARQGLFAFDARTAEPQIAALQKELAEMRKTYDPAEMEKLKYDLEECKKTMASLEKRLAGKK